MVEEIYGVVHSCDCFLIGEECICEEGCECVCPDCGCQAWDESLIGGCACGGNCGCGAMEEDDEGGESV